MAVKRRVRPLGTRPVSGGSAPIPVVRVMTYGRLKSTHFSRSLSATASERCPEQPAATYRGIDPLEPTSNRVCISRLNLGLDGGQNALPPAFLSYAGLNIRRTRVGRLPGDAVLVFGDHRLDIKRRELRRGDELIELEPKVFDLLAFLVRYRDRVVSKDE